MKRVVVIAAWLLAVASPAFAADLPAPAPVPQAPAAYIPPPAPVYNWGGVYFGINGGYGFGQSNWTTSVPTATTGTFSINGGIAGATIGANMQFDAFVAGIEGDFDGAWLQGTTPCNAGTTCETKDSWLGTLRLRLGYAADRVLLYGTAGGAFGNIEGNTQGTTFQNEVKGGWTAGAGVEAAFTDNLTGRVEYLFVDLQNAGLPTTGGATTTVKFDASLIRLGLVYKFR